MVIYLLSSSYPSKSAPRGTTPVVHYFAKEWVSMGHEVYVFHLNSKFPSLFYLLGRVFKSFLDTKLGYIVPEKKPVEYNEKLDGVNVIHLNIEKIIPHGRFSKTQLKKCFSKIVSQIENEGYPDVFVGHWDNPQLDILNMLKKQFNIPICLVLHANHFESLQALYGCNLLDLINNVDLMGFRNKTAQYNFELIYGLPNKSFIAASGVSKSFLDESLKFRKEFKEIRRFVYVGFLINRKCPVAVMKGINASYMREEFELTYIGSGKEKQNIENEFQKNGNNGKLIFTGRIPRDKVIEYLKNSDVFVMISREEIFGLVYLEAMALGCITIAARNEGIDGIIKDGENGFLCEAGNSKELTSIISKIRTMPKDELIQISRNAQKTASFYSDKKVAERYLKELHRIIEK